MLLKDINNLGNPDEVSSLPEGRSYILSIGIDKYRYCTQLNNAVRDAQKLVQILTQKYQFDSADAVLLIDDAATEKGIIDALEDLIEKAQPQDNVVIYFSGHGTLKTLVDKGYWVPVDGKFGDSSTTLSNGELITHIASIRARHVVLMVDACFSGTLIGQTRGAEPIKRGVNQHYLQRIHSQPSRWLLCSGRREPVSDGVPGENSPFAEYLLDFLNHYKDDSHSEVDCVAVSEVGQYISEQVATKHAQTPYYGAMQLGDEDYIGEFVFRAEKIKGTAFTDKNWKCDPPPPPPPPPNPIIKAVKKYGASAMVMGLIALFVVLSRRTITPPNDLPTSGIIPLGEGNHDHLVIVEPYRFVSATTTKAQTNPATHKNPDATGPKPTNLLNPDKVLPVIVTPLSTTPTPPTSTIIPPPEIKIDKKLWNAGRLEKGATETMTFKLSNRSTALSEQISVESDQYISVKNSEDFTLNQGENATISVTLKTDELPEGPFVSTMTIRGGRGQEIKIDIRAEIEEMCSIYVIVENPSKVVTMYYNGQKYQTKAGDQGLRKEMRVPRRVFMKHRNVQFEGVSELFPVKCDDEISL